MFSALLWSVALITGTARGEMSRDMVVAVGAEGEPVYRPIFEKESVSWSNAAGSAGLAMHVIPGSTDARNKLKETLDRLPKDGGDLWIVLIGHGTFDGRNAKFNLPGDDLSASDLAGWLQPFQRRIIVLNLFSASGAFLPTLSANNRVVVTATRSGAERNYSRFGEKLAASLDNPEADLDGDGRITLSELSVFATAETSKFYDGAQRIVTEHALLDDNGDRLGTETPLLTKPQTTKGSLRNRDGSMASEISLGTAGSTLIFTATQRERREAIERQTAELRASKPELSEDN
ncbi:MAG TPA: hypothetical protein VNB29_09305 [Chthoniobacterales bacterium]|nr:hypothetical protein [Chthoniobacterales bacterium]